MLCDSDDGVAVGVLKHDFDPVFIDVVGVSDSGGGDQSIKKEKGAGSTTSVARVTDRVLTPPMREEERESVCVVVVSSSS